MSRSETMPIPVVEAVWRKLGGPEELGREVKSDADLERAVWARLPLRALACAETRVLIIGHHISSSVIPARTRRHRQERHEPLTVEESDRLVRLVRVETLAQDVFGDPQKAARWLREPLDVLDDRPPIDVARTDAGARRVEQILAKIDWGAAA